MNALDVGRAATTVASRVAVLKDAMMVELIGVMVVVEGLCGNNEQAIKAGGRATSHSFFVFYVREQK